MSTYTRVSFSAAAAHPTTTELDTLDLGISNIFADMVTHRASPSLSTEHSALRIAKGIYTGNGGNGTTITTGSPSFQPVFVYVMDQTAGTGTWLVSGMNNWKKGVTNGGASGGFVATGFTAWNGDTNTNGNLYKWVAMG